MRTIRKMKSMLSGALCGILAWGVISSCTSEQEYGGTEEEDRLVPIEMCPSLDMTVETRASVLKTGEIGIYRAASEGYEVMNNVNYKYDATTSTWLPDATGGIYVDHRDATLFAYYPYTSTPPGNGVFQLNACRRPTVPDRPTYFSGTTPKVNNRETAWTFYLKPVYTQLGLLIRNENLSTAVIKKLEITSGTGWMSLGGKINVWGAEPTVVPDEQVSTPFSYPFVQSDKIYSEGLVAGKTIALPLYCIPQVLSGGLTIKIQFELPATGQVVATSVNIPQKSLKKLEMGYSYVINLLIKGVQLLFDTNSFPDYVVDSDGGKYLIHGEDDVVIGIAFEDMVPPFVDGTDDIYTIAGSSGIDFGGDVPEVIDGNDYIYNIWGSSGIDFGDRVPGVSDGSDDKFVIGGGTVSGGGSGGTGNVDLGGKVPVHAKDSTQYYIGFN